MESKELYLLTIILITENKWITPDKYFNSKRYFIPSLLFFKKSPEVGPKKRKRKNESTFHV
uniref:Uncharacterized protein n=1 Tax=Lepeophtheirus salmonis TaxID=72036 RepID=A0A0K2UK42_LEPSM